MGRPPSPKGDLERATVALLGQRMKALKVSPRDIEPIVGISYAKLYRMLAGQAPMTYTEFINVCRALDLDPARVVRTAEASVEEVPAYLPEEIGSPEEGGDAEGQQVRKHHVVKLEREFKPTIVRPVKKQKKKG